MKVSDAALRRALEERAATEPEGQIDLTADATRIARTPQQGRPSPVRWLALAAAALAVVVGAGLTIRVMSTSTSTPRINSSASAVESSRPSRSATATTAPATAAPNARPSATVTGCDELGIRPAQCAAIVARARTQAGNLDNIVAVLVAAKPEGPGITLGLPRAIWTVDLTLATGQEQRVEVSCGGGIPGFSDRVCNGNAEIFITHGIDEDVPCGAEPAPNAACATLPPTPRPRSVASSEALDRDEIDIRIDRVGHYEVLAGTASLADGYLEELSATLADATPSDFWIDDGIQIDVRSDIPGRPRVGSRYREPYDGAEPVHVYLVFDVTQVDAPNAVLQIRDLVVR